jgi:hypothetical protein
MGQRHQIYAKLPSGKVIGIHHQWLYGRTALKLLVNYLQFLRKVETEDRFNASAPRKECYTRSYQATGVLGACYSLIAAEGYFHEICPFDQHEPSDAEVLADPRQGDNNDGITIIDLSHEKPKFCFMSLHGLECAYSKRGEIKDFKPLSAEQYVSAYYPHWRENKDFNRSKNEIIECDYDLKGEIKGLLKSLEGYKTLTLAEVKKIFPKMFTKKGA